MVLSIILFLESNLRSNGEKVGFTERQIVFNWYGGRLTLIKASLANLPLYYMAIFPIPKGIIDEIQKIRRDFCEHKLFPFVRWEIVELPKSLGGGLSVGSFLNRNIALLFKWIWRVFLNKPQSLWRSIIRSKYKYSPSFSMLDLKIWEKGGPWQVICSTILKYPKAWSIVKTGMQKNFGDGLGTYFWNDPRIDSSPLKIKFPRHYSIAINKLASLGSLGF